MPTTTAHTPDQPPAQVPGARALGPVRATQVSASPSRASVVRASQVRTPWCAGGREGGQAAIQTAILLPLVLLVIIACIQATLWFAGRQVAIAAASEGARVAAAESGTSTSGQAAAVRFAATTGRGFLLTPQASVRRSGTIASVTVTGTTQSLIAGWDLTIHQTAAMPVERLTAPTGPGAP